MATAGLVQSKARLKPSPSAIEYSTLLEHVYARYIRKIDCN